MIIPNGASDNQAEASISDYKEGSLPPPINWSTRPRATLFSSAEASICVKKEGSLPPPIDWSTHPRATPPPSAEASIFDNKEGSLPPPINWSTHPRARSLPSTPKKSQLEYGGLSSQHGGTPLQTWVDPHFAIERPRGNGFQLDLYGHCFDAGVSFSAVPEPAPNINNSTLPEVPSQPDTSTQSTIVSGQDYPSPPGHPKYHFVASASSSAYTKYYIVVVGKCAGVFTFWPYVKSLVEGLGRAASYKGYRTFNDAALDYNKSKSLGLVRIRRLPGDDLFYGPESEAMQGEIRF